MTPDLPPGYPSGLRYLAAVVVLAALAALCAVSAPLRSCARRSIHAVMAMALVLGIVLTSGCSPTAIGRQAIAADGLARAFNDITRPALVQAFEAEGRAAVDDACCERAAMEHALAEVESHWDPVMAAYDAAKGLHDLWRHQITECRAQADAGPCTIDVMQTALRFAEAMLDYRCRVRAAGRPDLDPMRGALDCGGSDAGRD